MKLSEEEGTATEETPHESEKLSLLTYGGVDAKEPGEFPWMASTSWIFIIAPDYNGIKFTNECYSYCADVRN